MTRQVRMWVDPSFAKKVKIVSAMNEMSIIELTKKMAQDGSIIDGFKDDEKKKRGFRLDF